MRHFTRFIVINRFVCETCVARHDSLARNAWAFWMKVCGGIQKKGECWGYYCKVHRIRGKNWCVEDFRVSWNLGGSRCRKTFWSSFGAMVSLLFSLLATAQQKAKIEVVIPQMSLGQCSLAAVQWLTVSRCLMLVQYAGCAKTRCVLSGHIAKDRKEKDEKRKILASKKGGGRWKGN